MARSLYLCVVLALLSCTVQAGVVSLVGDKDCFGLGGSCPDGTLWRDHLGGTFFSGYQGAGDPSFTDKWSTDVNIVYQHTYALPVSPVAATLDVRFAGVADSRGPWDVLFNGTLLGQIPTNSTTYAFEEVKTYSWIVPVGLLTGSDTVNLKINVPVATDGYSIDYSSLAITSTGVPEPNTITLLSIFALAGLAALRRKLK